LSTMEKLKRTRSFLTLLEAARHLASELKEAVTETDVLRLGLDGRLFLSVVFLEKVRARRCEPDRWIYGREESDISDRERIENIFVRPGDKRLSWGNVISLEHDYPYDLILSPGCRAYIQQKFWRDSGESIDRLEAGGDCYVLDAEGVLQLQDTWGTATSSLPECSVIAVKPEAVAALLQDIGSAPVSGLPESSVIVLKTDALAALEKNVNAPAPAAERAGSLITIERNNLLKLVIGMAVGGYGYDHQAAKSSIPKQISDDLLGHTGLALSDDTVRKYLKEAAKLLPTKPLQS
jgi:hypothetical protein